MRPINELLLTMSIDEIDREIAERRSLIFQMVGTLYPSILNDEIEKLLDRKLKICSGEIDAGLLC